MGTFHCSNGSGDLEEMNKVYHRADREEEASLVVVMACSVNRQEKHKHVVLAIKDLGTSKKKSKGGEISSKCGYWTLPVKYRMRFSNKI
jgi:hypothetical protein